MAPKRIAMGTSSTDYKSEIIKSVDNVRFTSSETIDSVVCPDDTIEILGYVDALQAPRVVGEKGTYRLFKFVLNNDSGKRIQCLAWQDQIERVAAVVEMNTIIHLNGAIAKEITKPIYNTGNVPFELSIQQQTTIDGERGFFGVNSQSEIVPTVVEWSELGEMEGRKIVGLKPGCSVKIVGVMNFDKIPYLQVKNGSAIKLDDKNSMNTDLMHEITCTPKKKARKV